MNKTATIAVILVVLAGFLFWGFQTGFFAGFFPGPVGPSPLPSGIVLFFGQDCPHCIKVEAFIKDNNINSKVKITKLEIPFNNKTSSELVANSDLLVKTAQICKVDIRSGIAIPFLYDGNNKCYMGDIDVINFLSAQAGLVLDGKTN